MPASLRPMLASAAEAPFDSPDHIFELMWGGLRALAFVQDGTVTIRGSNGFDLTPFFPELAGIPSWLQAREAILDGEIVAVGPDGQPSLDMLRARLHAALDAQAPIAPYRRLARVPGQLMYQAFDILWLDGQSLMASPLWMRKNELHDAITPGPLFGAVDFVEDEGVPFFDAVGERKLEGIVAKHKISVYTPGRRSADWREIRALFAGDFVVGGYTFGGGRRRKEPLGQLLLGAYTEGRLVYVGSVSGGLSDVEAIRLLALLEPLVSATSPFIDPPPVRRLLYWTRPSLVCRVRYSERSNAGILRFPIFSTLRPDIAPTDCELD